MLNRVNYFKLSLLYTSLAALPPVIQLFTQPIIEGVDQLSAADFSRIGIAEQVTTLVFTIIIFSMHAAISRFYYDNNESKGDYNRLVSGTFISILFRGVIMFLAVFVFRNFIGNLFSQPELKDFSSYGFASVVIGINRAIFFTATALFRNERRVKAFVVVNIALALIRAGFQVSGVLLWDMSFLGYVNGSAIGGSLVSVFILFRIFRQSGFIYDREFMKPIYRFAFPLVQYGLISWALFFVDKYFMESNPVKLGIYITVMNFANGIMLIIQGIQAATQPEVFLYMKKGIAKHSAEIRSLGNMLMAQTQLVIALAIIPTIAYFHLFFETDIKLAATYVSIIYIRFIPRSQYFVYSFAIFYEKKTKFLFLINTINLFIAIWLNYLLIPILNIYGAVIAVLVSELIQMLGVFIYSRKTIPIQWNLSKTLYIPLVSLVLIIAIEIVKQYYNVNVYLSGALASLVIFGGLLIAYRNELKMLINKFV